MTSAPLSHNQFAGWFEHGAVRIDWVFAADTFACNVDVFWHGQLIARKRLVSADPTLVFDARGESSPNQCVAGQLQFDPDAGTLLLDRLRHADGIVASQILGQTFPQSPLRE